MKRFMAAALTVCLLAGAVPAGAVSVSDIMENRDGGRISFSGNVSGAEGKLMVKIYNKEYGEDNTAGFVRLDTITPDSDGNFEFTVVMPEQLADGSDSTGEYEIVFSDGISPARRTFLYMNTEDSQGIYAILETEDSSTIYTEMEGGFAESAAMTGIDIEAYRQLSDRQRGMVCDWFAANRNGQDTVKLFNKCIYANYITVCPDEERVITAEKLAPEYGEYSFADMSAADKEKAARYMSENAADSLEEISRIFGEAAVLAKLSNARKDDVTDILKENAELLKLEDSAAYSEYTALSAADRQKTNEKFISSLGGKMVSVEDISNILADSITKGETAQNRPQGGSQHGSSSSGSGTGILAPDKITSTPAPTQPGGSGIDENAAFNDLESAAWAKEAIETLASMGIVSGDGSGAYDPNADVTREAFVKMLLLASGMFETGRTADFSDVDPGQWYAEYIGCASEKNIVNGISETEFGVGMTITRQDMAVMLKRAADAGGKKLEEVREYTEFGDREQIADYAAEAVRVLYCANIINGKDDGNFHPAERLTRAEAAKVIYDMYVRNVQTSEYSPNSSYNPSASEYDKNTEFLTAAGVISADDALRASTEQITAAEFINMAYSVMQSKLYSGTSLSGEVRSAADVYGMLLDGVDDGDTITVAQAAEILVKAAGYGSIIENGEYWSRAGQTGILDGINAASTDIVTFDRALRMIRNLSDAPPAVVEYSGTMPVITILSDTTMLEKNKSIYKRRGIVTGNSLTTLYSADGLAEGRIEIDNTEYLCDNDSFGDYIGCNVTYYVQQNDDGDVVKYVEPTGYNEITVIQAGDFESIAGDFSSIRYRDGNRIRTVEISASPNVIYNGRYYGGYTADDFNIESGDITVISASGNEVDTVIINSYETMIFDRLSSDRTKLFNKYSHTGATAEINFSDCDYTIIKNGEEISLTELKEWDVLSVAAARGGFKPYYKILVSDTREEALTESYSYSDMTVTSIGYIYDIAGSYYDSFSENKGVGEELKLGEPQIYLMDSFGRVAAVLADSERQENYMYIVNVWMNEGGDSAGIKYYDVASQEFLTAEISYNAAINNRAYKAEELTDSPLFDADGKGVQQLVKLTTDDSGNVNSIETSTSAAEASPSQFTRTRVSTTWIYENSSFNYEAFLTSGAQILCVPDTGGSEDDFYVLDRSMYENDQVKNLATAATAYDIDEFMRTDMMVVNYSNTAVPDLSDTQNIFMIDKISQAVDEEGVEMRMLHGSIGNYEGMEFYIEDYNLVPDAAPGDALYVSFDKQGKIKSAERIFSLDQLLASEDIYESAKTTRDTERNSRTQLLTGWVDDVDLNAGANENMVMLDGTVMLPIRLNGLSSKAVVYDADAGVSSVQDISAVEPGDLMIVRLRYSSVRSVVVIKNINGAGA